MEYLLLRQKGFHIFTDHRNLQFIFDPRSIDNAIARYRADKLQRWSMVLQMFRYTVEHVAGSENVWGDLLSRWSRPNYNKERVSGRCCALSAVTNVSPLEKTDFEWPSLEQTKAIQDKALVGQAATSYTKDAVKLVWVDAQGRTWIPDHAVDHSNGYVSLLMRV